MWALLAVTVGPAAADALDGWSSAPQNLAGLLLWVAWAGVLLAILVPRPLGLTGLRVAAPMAVVLAVVSAPSTSGGTAVMAVATTAVAAALAFTPASGARFVNGAAYGNERRFVLRVPPGLLYGPLPLAALAGPTGAVAGPLLLADGRLVAGVVATALGWPVAGLAARSLYGLSQRWAVLVPAGIVLKDPMTLIDPVLFLRDKVAGLRPLPYPTAPADDVVDLRLGAVKGSLVLELAAEAQVLRARGRDRAGEIVNARRLAFSPTDAAGLLADANRRRIVAAG